MSESTYSDSAQVTTTDYSQSVGTSAVTIYTPSQFTKRLSFVRVWNVAGPGGGTVWLTRNPAIGLNVAANTPGCFPLAPGQYEVFNTPQAIPINALFAIATASGTPLTVEVG